MAKKKPAQGAPSAVAKSRTATVPDPAVLQPVGPVVRRTSGVKVRATLMGYYDHARRRPGDVFTIASGKDFSPRWMEVVPGNTPDKLTGAKAALEKIHDEIIGGVVTTAATGDEQLI